MGSTRDYKDHFYRCSDDRLDLYARIYGDCEDGIPVLMMHGLTRNSADFENIAEILRHSHKLIIPDQRGRGRSDYDTNQENYAPHIYVQDMFALLRSLDVEKVVLLGTSMGGLIAMLMAASKPEIVKSIILNDIGPEVDQAGLVRLQQYVGHPVRVENWQDAAAYCQKINAIAFPNYDTNDWTAFAKRTFIADGDGVPKLVYDPKISEGLKGNAENAAPPDLWSVWDMLSQIPILTVRGETSDILSPATLAKMSEQHGSDFYIVEVPDIGHAPMLDETAAVDAITAFLKRHS